VTIEVRAPQQAGAPRNYRARFCLLAQNNGALHVRNLGAGNLDPKLRHACAP